MKKLKSRDILPVTTVLCILWDLCGRLSKGKHIIFTDFSSIRGSGQYIPYFPPNEVFLYLDIYRYLYHWLKDQVLF